MVRVIRKQDVAHLLGRERRKFELLGLQETQPRMKKTTERMVLKRSQTCLRLPRQKDLPKNKKF
ncbi:unnamed protein product [Brassica oleracea var. botrytis]|uniref:Uncharacterized protein n=1 Tax=Brassica oleracea TaxID=3712 RepID=A0A3P6FNW3_BRAOL|nr:unnamed protein product [Brassica oleracea]